MLRSLAAVVAGFLCIGALSFGADAAVRAAFPQLVLAGGRVENLPWLVGSLVYVAVFAVSGSWLTARLAPRRPLLHAIVLGALGLAFTGLNAAQAWHLTPAWYNIISLALVLPYAWIGGTIRERQLRARAGA